MLEFKLPGLGCLAADDQRRRLSVQRQKRDVAANKCLLSFKRMKLALLLFWRRSGQAKVQETFFIKKVLLDPLTTLSFDLNQTHSHLGLKLLHYKAGGLTTLFSSSAPV